MTRIYHEEAADLSVLAGERVAVVGYGNQGRSQALNLRDSGVDVVIGNIRDEAHATALADAFEVLPIAEACRQSSTVMLLIPDEVMPDGTLMQEIVAKYSTKSKPETQPA